eukprot:150142-Chlamydomonas_euryale.AAC.2
MCPFPRVKSSSSYPNPPLVRLIPSLVFLAPCRPPSSSPRAAHRLPRPMPPTDFLAPCRPPTSSPHATHRPPRPVPPTVFLAPCHQTLSNLPTRLARLSMYLPSSGAIRNPHTPPPSPPHTPRPSPPRLHAGPCARPAARSASGDTSSPRPQPTTHHPTLRTRPQDLCEGTYHLSGRDLRDRTYYLSNGVIRVSGRRVATNAANFAQGDIVGVVLDADQGEIVFFRNGIEQGRARGIRGRLYPFVSCDSEGDQVGSA